MIIILVAIEVAPPWHFCLLLDRICCVRRGCETSQGKLKEFDLRMSLLIIIYWASPCPRILTSVDLGVPSATPSLVATTSPRCVGENEL